MSDAPFHQITIVGVGLLGGSLGLAAKKYKLADTITGVGRNPDRLSKAQQLGAIDSFTLDLEEGCKTADLIILGQPIQAIIASLDAVARAAPNHAIVTDLGSTKSSIVAKAEQCFNKGASFVGSHPMAGSHKTTAEFASADLFVNACSYVAATSATPLPALGRIVNFWKALGARPVIIHPERHDQLVAAISHVPHLIAAALALTAAQIPDDTNFVKLIAGKGFLDTTRVAQGDPVMWTEICLDNHQNISHWLNVLSHNLNSMALHIASGDDSALRDLLAIARDFRQSLEQE
jgi:prephenate dehydrogenase